MLVHSSFRYLLRRLIRRYHFIGVEYQPTLRLSLRSALGTAWVAFHTGLSYTPAARSTRLRARVKPSMVLMLGLRNLIALVSFRSSLLQYHAFIRDRALFERAMWWLSFAPTASWW